MPAAVARLRRDGADGGAFQADAVAREIERPEAVVAGQAGRDQAPNPRLWGAVLDVNGAIGPQ